LYVQAASPHAGIASKPRPDPLHSSACRSHHFGTFPMRPLQLYTSILPRCRLDQENTFQNMQRLKKTARANLQREIATWVNLAKLRHRPQQINVVAFRPAMHISPTKTFPRLAQQSRPWTTPRNVVIRILAYFRPCLG